MKKILKNSYRTSRSDMACEFIKLKKIKKDDIICVSEIYVDEKRAKAIGKNKGKYVNLDTIVAYEGLSVFYERVSDTIKAELEKFMVGKRVLVVGLGNYELGADSLGVKTCANINVTRNIIDSKFSVSAICPGVIGATGIESFEVVKGVCDAVKPETIFVIDSLCAGSVKRLLTSFQISDAGIVPGSGVANHRMALNESTLNAKVVSIGVPTVVYASTIIKESSGVVNERDLVVSPKDIDYMVKDCATIIANALNSLFLTQ